jgi:hypothetical protein
LPRSWQAGRPFQAAGSSGFCGALLLALSLPLALSSPPVL